MPAGQGAGAEEPGGQYVLGVVHWVGPVTLARQLYPTGHWVWLLRDGQ